MSIYEKYAYYMNELQNINKLIENDKNTSNLNELLYKKKNLTKLMDDIRSDLLFKKKNNNNLPNSMVKHIPTFLTPNSNYSTGCIDCGKNNIFV